MSTIKNAKLFAVEKEDRGFDVYLDLSGDAAYLMSHRSNPFVYRLLAEGVYLSDLERLISRLRTDVSYKGRTYYHGSMNPRLKIRKNLSRKVENSMRHIQRNAELYLTEYCA